MIEFGSMAGRFRRSQRTDRHRLRRLRPAPLQRAEILLPARGRFDLRRVVPPAGALHPATWRWHAGPPPVLERAERLATGSVYLLRITPAPRGVLLRVTGRAAGEIEVLAPLAVRVRRALALDLASPGPGRRLRGTTTFEDLVTMAATATGPALQRLLALGRPCPAKRGLRAFPSPAALGRLPIDTLRRLTGLGASASWISRLARAIASGRFDPDSVDERARARLPPPPGIDPAAVRALGYRLRLPRQRPASRASRT